VIDELPLTTFFEKRGIENNRFVQKEETRGASAGSEGAKRLKQS
jgi:hypothetical protein